MKEAEERRMSTRHESILMAQIGEGLSTREICERFDISEKMLRIYRSDPIWKERESELKDELESDRRTKLSKLAGKAINALDQVVDSPDDSMKLRAAAEILDRSGYPKGLQIDTNINPVINLFMPEYLLPKHDKRLDGGNVIDIEGVEE